VLSLLELIRAASPQGLQITVFPTRSGRFPVSVKETGADGWTCETGVDAAKTLERALRRRAARVPDRLVISGEDLQIDLEDAIARMAPVSEIHEIDEFEALLG